MFSCFIILKVFLTQNSRMQYIEYLSEFSVQVLSVAVSFVYFHLLTPLFHRLVIGENSVLRERNTYEDHEK